VRMSAKKKASAKIRVKKAIAKKTVSANKNIKR
jgi:hypothetical protein